MLLPAGPIKSIMTIIHKCAFLQDFYIPPSTRLTQSFIQTIPSQQNNLLKTSNIQPWVELPS